MGFNRGGKNSIFGTGRQRQKKGKLNTFEPVKSVQVEVGDINFAQKKDHGMFMDIFGMIGMISNISNL